MFNLSQNTKTGRYGFYLGLGFTFVFTALFKIIKFLPPDISKDALRPAELVYYFFIFSALIITLPILSYKIGKLKAVNKPIRSVFRFSLSFVFTPLVSFYIAFILNGSPPFFLGLRILGDFAQVITLIVAPPIAFGVVLTSLLFGYLGSRVRNNV